LFIFSLQQELQGHKAGEEEAEEVEEVAVAKGGGEGAEVKTAMMAGHTQCATLTSS